MASRPVISIDNLSDPRIDVYTRLKDREVAAMDGRFIAEGELVVRRLLASEYFTESVLLADRRVEEISTIVPEFVTIYSAPTDLVNKIVGFKFHSGVMACGRRGKVMTLNDLPICRSEREVNLVILPEIAATDNLGSLIRISSAFGASAMILGEHSCDPFYRQSIRVSMGTIFGMPLVHSADLMSDLQRLRHEFAVELIASVADEKAMPLAGAKRSKQMGFLFGNEAQGLSKEQIDACDRQVTIPMQLGTDSLNVSVAAGVVLYHFTQYAAAPASAVTLGEGEDEGSYPDV
jgi:tRNA G18 (ribose-2'-O)-methylase SpoU